LQILAWFQKQALSIIAKNHGMILHMHFKVVLLEKK
jgi:hypothetical protein